MCGAIWTWEALVVANFGLAAFAVRGRGVEWVSRRSQLIRIVLGVSCFSIVGLSRYLNVPLCAIS